MKSKLILSLFIIMIIFITTGCSNNRTNNEKEENNVRNDTKYNINVGETK